MCLCHLVALWVVLSFKYIWAKVKKKKKKQPFWMSNSNTLEERSVITHKIWVS